MKKKIPQTLLFHLFSLEMSWSTSLFCNVLFVCFWKMYLSMRQSTPSLYPYWSVLQRCWVVWFILPVHQIRDNRFKSVLFMCTATYFLPGPCSVTVFYEMYFTDENPLQPVQVSRDLNALYYEVGPLLHPSFEVTFNHDTMRFWYSSALWTVLWPLESISVFMTVDVVRVINNLRKRPRSQKACVFKV